MIDVNEKILYIDKQHSHAFNGIIDFDWKKRLKAHVI
jgi:hypothetical protein